MCKLQIHIFKIAKNRETDSNSSKNPSQQRAVRASSMVLTMGMSPVS
jgi:hypothetical protein